MAFSRKNIQFNANGTTLRGWLYLPKGAIKPVPGIVVTAGFSGVKELYMDKYAEVFADAGMGVVVYDHRNFGDSDGEPRQEIDPWAQARDYRHAISYLRTLPEINRDKIGIWGSSYSGGLVLIVGAVDRRVKAVVAQVPVTKLYDSMRHSIREDFFPGFLDFLAADREARFAGKPGAMIPVVSEDPNGMAVLPQKESWEFCMEGKTIAPNWKNEVTLQTVDNGLEFVPWAFVHRISPTPLLMIIPTHDSLVPTSHGLDTYNRALEPKKLVMIDGGHFSAYVDHFEITSVAARDWFVEHLCQ